MAPKDVHILILRGCEYVTLRGKRDFASVMELRTSRCREYTGLPRWVSSNHLMAPNIREPFSVVVRASYDYGRTVERFDISGFEDRGRGREPRNVSDL